MCRVTMYTVRESYDASQPGKARHSYTVNITSSHSDDSGGGSINSSSANKIQIQETRVESLHIFIHPPNAFTPDRVGTLRN